MGWASEVCTPHSVCEASIALEIRTSLHRSKGVHSRVFHQCFTCLKRDSALLASNQVVGGSIPSGPTIEIK